MIKRSRLTTESSIGKAGINYYHIDLPKSHTTAEFCFSTNLPDMDDQEIIDSIVVPQGMKVRYLEISGEYETMEDALSVPFKAKRSRLISEITGEK
jgi:hypothetical protein